MMVCIRHVLHVPTAKGSTGRWRGEGEDKPTGDKIKDAQERDL